MRYRELPPGKYAVGVSGLLCTVCARALAAELAKVPQIESATADFHKEQAVIVVKLDATLTVNDVYRAMRRAERLSNLGGRFELRDVKYIP
jgi:copper chaperone CopZ